MSLPIPLDKEEILPGIVDTKNTTTSVFIRKRVTDKVNEEMDRDMYNRAVEILEDDSAEFVWWEDAKEKFELEGEV